MSEPNTRQQQKLEEVCAGVIRAFTGDAEIQYRGRRLHKGHRALPLHAPHLQTDPARDRLASFRGAADGIALRLRHSDPLLHRRLCPEQPVERLIFELLEQLRAESFAPDSMPGMTHNLHHRFETWSQAFHESGLTETASGLLLYTVFQICWSRLTARPVLEKTEDLIEATRASIVPMLGVDLAGLRRHRGDQQAYATHAAAIARCVGDMIREEEARQNAPQAQESEDAAKSAFKLLLDFDSDDDGGAASAPLGESKALDDSSHGYAVFTTQYDREEGARSLVRAALLREYRERLDRRIAELGINHTRLARQLAQLLTTPHRSGWSFGEEDGYIDGRRLAQLISSPAERRLFRREEHKPQADCLVTFLIDCSGSMKTHAEGVTIIVDVLARALEKFGTATEVLGFTTGAWNGGRAQREWARTKSPRHPGRLNERFHIVFKDAEHAWRNARTDLGALLKADLYREGIDGEAVEWACARMRAHQKGRRILLVISDGCPMDSATALANDDFYLANHLKEVVARQEQRGDVEICALGVGLDLSPYYTRSLATELPQSLNNRLFSDIAQLIGSHQR